MNKILTTSDTIYILHEINLVKGPANKLIMQRYFSGVFSTREDAVSSLESYTYELEDGEEFNAQEAWHWTIQQSKKGKHSTGTTIATYDCWGEYVSINTPPDYVMKALANGV